MGDIQALFFRALELRKEGKTPFIIRKIFEQEQENPETIEKAMKRFDDFREYMLRQALGAFLIIFGIVLGAVSGTFIMEFLEKENTPLLIFVSVIFLISCVMFFVGISWIVKNLSAVKKLKSLNI